MRLYTLAYDFFDDPLDWAFAALFAMLTLVAWGRLWEPSIGGPLTNLALNFAALVVILLAAQYLWRSWFPNYPFGVGPAWRRFAAYPLRQFVYAAAGLLVVSGGFEAIFSGASFDVLGISAGSSSLADPGFADVARAMNQIAAFALPGAEGATQIRRRIGMRSSRPAKNGARRNLDPSPQLKASWGLDQGECHDR